MFDFTLSPDLVRKICNNLEASGVTLPNLTDAVIETGCREWGRCVVGALGMQAHYNGYKTDANFKPFESFSFITDGRFCKDIEDHLGGVIGIPLGEVGDLLLEEVAAEFTAWVEANGTTVKLSERAPVTKMEVVGKDVVIYTRAKDPPIEDQAFVQATEVE